MKAGHRRQFGWRILGNEACASYHASSLVPRGNRRLPQMWHGLPMIATDIKALAAIGYGADENRLPGAIVVLRVVLGGFGLPRTVDLNQVECRGGEIGDSAAFLVGHIASHREGLEIDFWPHHG